MLNKEKLKLLAIIVLLVTLLFLYFDIVAQEEALSGETKAKCYIIEQEV